MLILAIDATGAACSAALCRNGEVIASLAEVMEKGHAERLFPLIREMMSGHGLSEIDAIAVCTGPGNFTGARIGVAAARGLALSLGVASVGVDRFEAVAAGAADVADKLCIVLPARGVSVHAALFEAGVLRAAETINRDDLLAFSRGALLHEITDTDIGQVARVAAVKLQAGDVPRPAPRYLRPVNAALPAEAPPPLLP